MEKAPQKKEQMKEVTVSKEIREALSAEWLVEGEDVRLPDYIKMKTELRDILTPVGIWSDNFSAYIDIDTNLLEISLLGKQIESVGKWMERRSNPHTKKELEWYRSCAKKTLERIACWSSAFEVWLEKGSPKDLQKVGENMDYMSRAYFVILRVRSEKDFLKKNVGVKKR